MGKPMASLFYGHSISAAPVPRMPARFTWCRRDTRDNYGVYVDLVRLFRRTSRSMQRAYRVACFVRDASPLKRVMQYDSNLNPAAPPLSSVVLHN